MTFASTSSLFEKETEIVPCAPSTTWALVRMWPSLSNTKPEPRPLPCSTRTTPAPYFSYICSMSMVPVCTAGMATELSEPEALFAGVMASWTMVVVEPPSCPISTAVPPAARPADRSEAINTGTTMREPRCRCWFCAAGGGFVV